MPSDRQRMFMVRRLGAVAIGILILILLVLGIRGCLNAREQRAYEDYARDLTTLVQEEQALSEGFFGRFADPGNLSELNVETEIRADRSQAEQLLGRAESLDPPGELDGAQDEVVSAFELRRDGLGAIADNIGVALGDEDTTEATEQIVLHIQDFLASDVLYRQARDEINAVLQEQGIDEDVPESVFLDPGGQGLDWLDETTVQEALTTITGSGGATSGLHGLGIASVLIGGTALTADTTNTVAGNGSAEVEVQVDNQGDSEETEIPVQVTVTGGDEPIEGEETLDTIAPAETQSVTVPLDPEPPNGEQLTLEVTVEPVPEEQVAENNEFTAEVTFE
ncbi:MAG: hypothetical protein ACRDL1_04500 [Solirubrobacterales bacterium]